MKPDYGNKYTCFKCGCKFYDLKKPKPICPKFYKDPLSALTTFLCLALPRQELKLVGMTRIVMKTTSNKKF